MKSCPLLNTYAPTASSKLLLLGLVLCLQVSCSKEDVSLDLHPEQTPRISLNVRSEGSPQDSIVDFTMLGPQRNNPYTAEALSDAALEMYGQQRTYTTTHRYVRFEPTTPAELATLYEWETFSGIDLYDHPLDREVLTAGQLYVPAGVSDTILIPWYGVVPVDATLPAVPHTELENIVLDE